jgi:hypothetical protein
MNMKGKDLSCLRIFSDDEKLTLPFKSTRETTVRHCSCSFVLWKSCPSKVQRTVFLWDATDKGIAQTSFHVKKLKETNESGKRREERREEGEKKKRKRRQKRKKLLLSLS